jgi:hypothetical protein
MKKGILGIIVLVFTAFSSVTAQTNAPNAEQTYYYKQIGVVRNNNRTTGDNTGQFITFTRRGCYDSDKNGIQAGDGFLAYQGVDNNIHIYNGDTYWGKAHYYFYNDFARINIIASDGVIYVYEKTTPPTNAVNSAYVYKKPHAIVRIPDSPPQPINPAGTDNRIITSAPPPPPPDHTAELRRLQERYTRLKNNKADAERHLQDTYVPVIDSGIAKGYFDSRNSIRETIRLYERQMADIRQQARNLGGSVN